jgi:Trypsin/Tachylectin
VLADRPPGRRPRLALAGLVVSGLVLVAALPASAVTGPTANPTLAFVANIEVGEASRACSGALVAPQWILTSASCFTEGGVAATLGPPTVPTTATVGVTDTAGTGAQRIPIVRLIPRGDRDVLLAKLVTPATGVTPVTIATSAPAAGDTLQMAGFGRTTDQWRPDGPHTATFTVNSVNPATLSVTGTDPDGASLCLGDAGGPALSGTGSSLQLVGTHYQAGQGGCLGSSSTDHTATENRADDLAGWVRQSLADLDVFGVRADGHLTYSVIDSATGDRLTTITSTQTLSFPPKALAVLNATTLLITSTSGQLYRVDILATNPALTIAGEEQIASGGWTHNRLAYDGDGSLFGIAGSTLRRYTVTSANPEAQDIINNTLIGSGFTLPTLTTIGPDWILGTVSDGRLQAYKISAAGGWTPFTLAAAGSGWNLKTQLFSPGDGLYYAANAAGRLDRYRDASPFDGKGTDILGFPSDPVDVSGWDQAQLAAVPFRAQPDNPGDVSVFGALPSGNLTFSALDASTGNRLTTVTSAAKLGFTPKALAAINYNTLLVTSTSGALYRVDILATVPTLIFSVSAPLAGGGWTHDHLAYDGAGSLWGQVGTALRRYTLTTPKPTSAADLTNNTLVIASGLPAFVTFTSSGPNTILGSTTTGQLYSYLLPPAGGFEGHILKPAGWATLTQLTSPGAGLYYAQTAAGRLDRYLDVAPLDGVGTDIQAFPNDPVDTTGWNQSLLSAVPFTS